MPDITTFSALMARERIASLRAEAGRPVPKDGDRAPRAWDQRPRPAATAPSAAVLLPLRWIPDSP